MVVDVHDAVTLRESSPNSFDEHRLSARLVAF